MLSEEEEKELLDFLNKNKDVFAWSAGDLRGVSRDIVEHHLDIRSGTKPKTQRPHKMPDEKSSTIKAEVQRLLDVKVIREVKYPTWLANTVSVKKKNGKWRMYIDFTDLNKVLTAIISYFDHQLLGYNMSFTPCSIHILLISNKCNKFWMSCGRRN